MTSFEISPLRFESSELETWAAIDPRRRNWPVVYVLDGGADSKRASVYVGETRSALGRLRQHLASPERASLTEARVILDSTFNKSVCLDLESFLIRWFAGDGVFAVLNRNDGIVDADYYDREAYRQRFRDVFEQLRAERLFSKSIPQIENSDLFKLSPFKALTQEQAVVIEDLVEGLVTDLLNGVTDDVVLDGQPGTGKTVVAIYLIKLLRDIGAGGPSPTEDSIFVDYYQSGYREALQDLKIGFVIPQQSLRRSVKRVFKLTPGLEESMVLSPFEVGESTSRWDLLVVDETHRLNQRAAQASAVQNTRFKSITTSLFGSDDIHRTQLDWIEARSTHRLLLIDPDQTVRPADLPTSTLRGLVERASRRDRRYRLLTQMRVRAGSDYVGLMRDVLSGRPPRSMVDLGDYDLRLYDDPMRMREAIRRRNAERGLARMVAGYAWDWRSKRDPSRYDIEVGALRMRWNGASTDWIASLASVDEVGSIHTVQGYDLNFAGVLIGADLRFDPIRHSLFIDRSAYFDRKGKQNNAVLGLAYDDVDLQRFIVNIYVVLLTRGIRGTYIHAVDPPLQEYLRQVLPLRN